METPFRLAARIRSFRHAFAGLHAVLRTQHNAWIHAVATLGAIGAGLGLGISRPEWCAVVLAIAGVWSAEAFNTALESLADAVAPAPHPLVGRAKDCAAAAVLVAEAGAVAVGLLVFGRRLPALLAG